MRIEMVSIGEAGVELQGSFEFFLSLCPIQIIMEPGQSQIAVGLSESIILLQCLESRLFHLRKGLPRRNSAKKTTKKITVCFLYVSQGKIRVELYRLIKIFTIARINSLEIDIQSLGIHSPSFGQPEPCLLTESDADLPRDILGNFALDKQKSADVAFVAFDPELPVFGRLNQPGCDPHFFPRPQDRTFNHHVGIKLLGNLRQSFFCFYILHDRSQRSHPQGADLSQFSDERICHDHAKIFLLRIWGEILQRKHGQRLYQRSFCPAGQDVSHSTDIESEQKTCPPS